MEHGLKATYAVLALAAGARAGVQTATDFGRAPLAYVCSAVAAAVYLLIAVALRRRGGRARRVAAAGCAAELAGVLVVGTLTAVDPGAFPDDTVWSLYGAGYGFVPLVLPPLALWWLGRGRELQAGPAGPGGLGPS